jgi:hypothetical protein
LEVIFLHGFIDMLGIQTGDLLGVVFLFEVILQFWGGLFSGMGLIGRVCSDWVLWGDVGLVMMGDGWWDLMIGWMREWGLL